MPAEEFGKINEGLSRLCHEMKTIIASVGGALEVLRESRHFKDDAALKGLFDITAKNTFKLSKLVNDLLSLARREARGVPALMPREVPLKDCLDASMGMLKYVSQKREIADLEISLPHGLTVWADPDQLVQVFANLIENALKFTPPAGKIGVFAREKGPDVLVCVWDEGIGISREERGKIFEPFYRAGASAAQKGGGSGIGLAIAKGIIEQHKGKIWVESGPEKGSKFCFTVPTKK